MNPLNLDDVYEFVDTYIIQFHERRLEFLKNANLQKLVQQKNPYLFRAKNVVLAQDYISNILDSFLASQEETMFGDFLEALAIFIASKTYNGYKLTTMFVQQFCLPDGTIDWEKLVQFNSQNLDTPD